MKVRAFVWTTVLEKINTLDNLHTRRTNKAPSPSVYLLCLAAAEDGLHLFLHCKVAKTLWDRLFGVKGEYWVSSPSLIIHMQGSYVGFGRQKQQKTLWRCAFLAIFWVVWLEQNYQAFHKRAASIEGLWERVVFLASLWSYVSGVFHNYSLTDIQRDWRVFL